MKDETYHNCATLTGHEGPVWQVAWAHPKFGVILASCSYDGSVIIYRESLQNTWTKVYEHKFHDSSVNSIAWAPHEFGLILACASSDGRISTLEHKVDTWILKDFKNDTLGCNAVSWAPFGAFDCKANANQDGQNNSVMRLVTGSCDNVVRFWRYSAESNDWEKEGTDNTPHTDWVRDVAWAPNTAMPYNIVASCSEDKSVHIWSENEAGHWSCQLMNTFDAPVWRTSWSVTGNVLAVSTGDHQVTLWKQSVDEKWVQMGDV